MCPTPLLVPAFAGRHQQRRAKTYVCISMCPMCLCDKNYLITHLNNFNFPLNGGYLISGSNQAGVFMTAFL